LGIKALSLAGPQPFDPPLEGWTWEAVSTPIQTDSEKASPFQQIEVIVRHDDPAVVCRLNQLLRLDATKGGGMKAPGIDSF
jgi:hypothetical protein